MGVLSLAGKTPRVLVTLTPDLGKVLNAMSEVEISGETNLTAGLQIAQLALKHRQNKNGRAKLVLFIGSPIRESTEDLVKLGKKLKKNSVAVDVVSFGGESDNDAKLEAFHQAVNGEGGEGHLLVVPAGGPVLADYLISSPLFGGEEGGNPFGAAAGGGGGFEFGERGEGEGGRGVMSCRGDPVSLPQTFQVLPLSSYLYCSLQVSTRAWTPSWPWPCVCRWRRSRPGWRRRGEGRGGQR